MDLNAWLLVRNTLVPQAFLKDLFQQHHKEVSSDKMDEYTDAMVVVQSTHSHSLTHRAWIMIFLFSNSLKNQKMKKKCSEENQQLFKVTCDIIFLRSCVPLQLSKDRLVQKPDNISN